MTDEFEIKAQRRDTLGTSANRRLRRNNWVPAVVYGSGESVAISIKANELANHLKNEAFYSHILTLKLDGKEEPVILRGLQRHPSEERVMHLDLLRVSESQAIRVHVPLHFLNEETCIGVKQQGGVISHLQSDVEVSCLPRYLPEFIEVDVANIELGHSLHLSDIRLPKHVEIVALIHGEASDNAIVSVNIPRVTAIEEEKEVLGEEAAVDTETVGAVEGGKQENKE